MNNLTAYKCLDCGEYTISRLDGIRCVKCSGVLTPMGNAHMNKNKYLPVDVNIKGTDKFKIILEIIKDIIVDKQVPIEIRNKIKEKILSVVEIKP
ncbi:hypothetical protein FDB42_17585 [Clostridium botulinum]|nr:hypothetical protein [Clostridium botulinum]